MRSSVLWTVWTRVRTRVFICLVDRVDARTYKCIHLSRGPCRRAYVRAFICLVDVRTYARSSVSWTVWTCVRTRVHLSCGPCACGRAYDRTFICPKFTTIYLEQTMQTAGPRSANFCTHIYADKVRLQPPIFAHIYTLTRYVCSRQFLHTYVR